MIYKGNPVSAGIAIGSAFVYDPKILTAPEDAPVLPMECELERYENAVQAAQAKLREIQAAFTGKDDDKAEIFSAHLDMVDDEEISEEIRSAIHAGTGAAKAVEQVYQRYADLLAALDDDFNSVSSATTDASLKSSVHVIITDQGTDLRDSAYAEIWKGLRTWAIDTKERVLLSELENSSDLFSQKEKPYRDCIFQIGGNEEQYKCDLFWKKSQVALFTSDNEDCYAAAKNSNIRCIYCADDTVTVRKILDMLKGR